MRFVPQPGPPSTFKAGQQIHIPVALCISKLDLLVNQSYAQGSDVIEQFYQDLSQIDLLLAVDLLCRPRVLRRQRHLRQQLS